MKEPIKIIGRSLAFVGDSMVFSYPCDSGCFRFLSLRRDKTNKRVLKKIDANPSILVELQEKLSESMEDKEESTYVYVPCKMCFKPTENNMFCSEYCRHNHYRISTKIKNMKMIDGYLNGGAFQISMTEPNTIAVIKRKKPYLIDLIEIKDLVAYYNECAKYGGDIMIVCGKKSKKPYMMIPREPCDASILYYAKIYLNGEGGHQEWQS